MSSRYEHGMELYARKRSLLIFLAYYLTSLAIGLALINSSPNKWDSAEFLRNIALMDEGAFDLIAVEWFPGNLQYGHPMYFVAGTIFYMVLSPLGFDVELSTLLMSLVLGGFIPVFVHKIAYNLYSDESLALFAGLLTLFNPLILWYSNEIMADVPTLFFITLAFLCETEFFASGRRGWLLPASISLSMAFLTRFSALFAYPAFLFLIALKKQSLKSLARNVAVSSLSLVIPAAFIAASYAHYNQDLGGFFYITDQARFSVGNLNAESLVISLGFLINSFTSLFIAVLAAGLLMVLARVLRRSILFGREFYARVGFPLVWCVFFLAYSLFLPAYVCRFSRYNLIIEPAFILLFVGVVAYLREYMEGGRTVQLLILAASALIAADFTIMFDISFFRYYDILHHVSGNFQMFIVQALAVFCILQAAYYVVRHKLGESNTAFVVLILSSSSLLYTLPVLYLNHTRTNHEKAEALWFAENTEADALIIAGHEFPFDVFYAGPREVIFIQDKKYSAVKQRIVSHLRGNKPAYFSENEYLKNSVLHGDGDFRFVKVGHLGKDGLRNQFEHEFIYMSYYVMSKSEDLSFYRIEFSDGSGRTG